ncbi:hypothetical protein AMECASPLE_031527 [Ameca splendens]|uniref:Uncharacterized protein n=1 Tax=Ameca splendens TaxID=208324 RepID=A0ABV1A2K4_9TELE
MGNDMSRGLRSLGPWLDLLRCRWLPVGPVGSSLQLPGVSAIWPLGGSPGAFHCSSLGGLRLSWRRSFWDSRALGGLCMSVAHISSLSVLGPGGQVCGSSHSLLHIFKEEPYIHKCSHTYTLRCLDSGVNR